MNDARSPAAPDPARARCVDDALRAAAAALAPVSPSPALDARVLLADALGRSTTWLVAHGDEPLPAPAQQDYDQALARRRAGEPVAYILGHREFWSLDLAVNPGTLIPRPDTETLVRVALALAADARNPRFADLGTGSGAIALALASERVDATVIATDRSDAALGIARSNAQRLRLNRQIRFRQGDWFDALDPDDGPFDLIASNPPYVRRDDPHLAEGDVRFEPELALVAGADGLSEFRRIAPRSLRYLRTGGWLVVEHGADQGAALRTIMGHAHLRDVATETDLAGQPRVTFGRRL